MKFRTAHRIPPTVASYPKESLHTAREFAKKMHAELGTFIKTLVVFGETARKTGKEHDIDILVVVDDVSIIMSPQVINSYRIITQKLIGQTSKRLHVMSLKFTSFWEYVRQGDPVIVNVLRDGVALIDYGFFDPLQLLLRQGRIRPTEESIWNYAVRAPTTINNSKWHVIQATLDLYWAAIDAAHAALMSKGVIPPKPEEVSNLIQTLLVTKGLAKPKHSRLMADLFTLSKEISHREVKEMDPVFYNKLLASTEEFVDVMTAIAHKEMKKR